MHMQSTKTVTPLIAVLTIICALVTVFWAPALFDNKSLIHGDSLIHGLPLWHYYQANLHTPENLVWDRYTYGGHPLFAEGQGGFAFPLHILLVHIMSAEYAHNFAHWLEMILAGVAVIGLGRSLKLSYWACGFAALSTIFSSYWMQMQQNMTISAAMMTIPWILWAGEHWFARPSWIPATLFGCAVAVGILAGYPHCLHGAIVYFVVSLLPHLFTQQSRIALLVKLPSIFKSGLLATSIAIGLAAIQLLPLLELTRYSHRAAGTTASFFYLPLSLFMRGLLYALKSHELDPPNFFPVIGSLLICLFFTLSVFFKLNTRLCGHVIATLLLLSLGIGGASPLSRLIYEYHLIPGMHYFRYMAPYLLVANIGISLIAAHSIDRLAIALTLNFRWSFADIIRFVRGHRVKLIFFVSIWIIAFYIAGFDIPVSTKHIAITFFSLAGIVALAYIGHSAKIPALLLVLLVAEIVIFKIHDFHFGSTNLLSRPPSAALIESEDSKGDFKMYSASFAFLYALGSPKQAAIEQSAKKMLAQLCGLSNLSWTTPIPSMMGALALPLKERVLLDPVFEAEANLKSSTAPGLRLIDLLSVKYITSDQPLSGASFSVKFHDPETDAWLIENSAAKPKFQAYTNYIFANSPEEALRILLAANVPTLTIEQPSFFDRHLIATIPLAASHQTEATLVEHSPIQFTVIEDEPTHYQLSVKAKSPGWLFLADANYPGWHAYIDNKEAPIYTGQILGKAVYVPQGNHDIVLEFKSISFQLGWYITITLLVAVLVALIISVSRTYLRRTSINPT